MTSVLSVALQFRPVAIIAFAIIDVILGQRRTLRQICIEFFEIKFYFIWNLIKCITFDVIEDGRMVGFDSISHL